MLLDINTWLNLLSLPMIIVIGLIISYEDLKTGRIRNKWVVTSLIYSIIFFSLFFLIMFFVGHGINTDYLKLLLFNVSLSIFVAFLLWHIHLWSAGDAKLFIAYAVAVPLTVYKNGYFQFFPSLILLINTFTPIFLFFLAKLLIKTSLSEKLNKLKGCFQPRILLLMAVYIFSLSWIFKPIQLLLKFQINLFVMAFLLFIIIALLEYIIPLNKNNIFLVIVAMRFIFDRSIFSLLFIKSFLLLLISFLIIRYVLLNLSYEFFTKEIYIEKLEEGMSLADHVKKEGKKYFIEEGLILSIFEGLEKGKGKETVFSSALSKSDVKKIKKLHSSGKIDQHSLRVHETIPFAIFIFIGVLLTYIAQGNVLFLLKEIIEKLIGL